MTPEEIQRVKDLLPTTLGSEEIRARPRSSGDERSNRHHNPDRQLTTSN